MLVAMVLPGGDFFFEGRLVGNAAAQTLARQDAEFGFGHVEPASVFRGVVPFEPFGQAARFWRGKGRVERGGRVRAQIVLDQPDLFSVGKMHVRQFLEHLRVIGGGVAVGDLDAAPALERRENHEYVGHAVALVFVIVPDDSSGSGRNRSARLDDQLLGGFIQTDEGAIGIARLLVSFQHVFHGGDEAGVGVLAKRYGVDRKTIAKWKARKFSSDVQMGPKNPRSKFLTLDDEVIILAYRWRTRLSLDDSLVRLRRLMPQLSRSALYRCLERNGLSKIGRTNVSPPLTSARAAVVITSADELPSLMGL